jgi:hypothetical protein
MVVGRRSQGLDVHGDFQPARSAELYDDAARPRLLAIGKCDHSLGTDAKERFDLGGASTNTSSYMNGLVLRREPFDLCAARG